MLPMSDVMVPHTTSSVPAFLAKLWKMVDDSDTSHLISWSPEGNSFVIHHQAEFAQSLLPFYYKHSNLASFVRQLNMYGFHKVVGVDSGGLKSEKQEEMEFAHPCFVRGMEVLLEKIKRKVSSKGAGQTAAAAAAAGVHVPEIKTERVNEVLNEVHHIKDKQEDLDGKLDTMKKENEALWREVVNLRQKHQNQQKIVNKLIQFLVSMVQPRMTGGVGGGVSGAVKRRYPAPQLAIEGASLADMTGSGLSPAKEAKLSSVMNAASTSAVAGGSAGLSNTSGPIIHDVTNEASSSSIMAQPMAWLFQQNDLASPTESSGTKAATIEMPDTPEPVPTTTRPFSPAFSSAAPGMQAVDPALVSPSIVSVAAVTGAGQSRSSSASLSTDTGSKSVPSAMTKTTAVTTTRPTLMREISKEDLDQEMNNMQSNLDNLKDVLAGQITMDSSLISSLFHPDAELPNLYSGLSGFSVVGGGSGGSSGSSSEQLTLPLLQLDNSGSGNASFQQQQEQPTLFELADIDESDAGGSHQPVAPKFAKVDVTKGSGGGGSINNDGDILNTPLVFADQTDPLVSILKK